MACAVFAVPSPVPPFRDTAMRGRSVPSDNWVTETSMPVSGMRDTSPSVRGVAIPLSWPFARAWAVRSTRRAWDRARGRVKGGFGCPLWVGSGHSRATEAQKSRDAEFPEGITVMGAQRPCRFTRDRTSGA